MENKAIAPQQRGVSKKDQVSAFKNLLECKYYQEQLKNVLKENSGTFATSVMEAVTSNDSLLACDPKKIMGEVVKAAGMKLPVNKQLGYCYILPFKNHGVPTPTLIVGYKGYIQLAMRTGQYRNINADIVYEGEYKGYDKVTGRLDLSGERTSNKVIGYFAYFELLNGFNKILFMTISEIAHYAKTFSPSLRGDRVPEESLTSAAQRQASEGAISDVLGWQGDFNGMAQKTVLKRLLSKYGILSIEMADALSRDEAPTIEQQRDNDNNSEKTVIDATATEVKEEAQENDNPFK